MSTQTDMSFPPDVDVSYTVTQNTLTEPHSKTIATQSEDDNLSIMGAVGGSASAEKQSPTTSNPHYMPANANSYIPIQSSTPRKKIQLVSFKPGPLSSKQGPGNRPPKGSEDPIKTLNKFGALDTMDLDVTHLPMKGPVNKKK